MGWDQRLASFFCKESENKYFSVCEPHILWVSVVTTQLCHRKQPQTIGKGDCLCSDITKSARLGGGPNLAYWL